MASRKKPTRKQPYNVEKKRGPRKGIVETSPDDSRPDIILPTPSVSTSSPNDVLPQGEQFVSRNEFSQLQKSMNEMSSVFNSLISALQSGSGVQSAVVTRQPVASAGVNAIVNQPQAAAVLPGLQNITNPDSEMPSTSYAVDNQVPSTSQDVDMVVQSAVNDHLSSIVNPGESFCKPKVSYQVDRRIPEKTLQLIWEDQFVDLTTMIPKEIDPEAPMQLIQGKPGEPATWAPVKPDKMISSISQWSELFDVYVAAYSRKHPDQTPNLLTHKANVIQLNSEGADYMFYDIEFRKAHSKFGIPWENPDMQLWVKAANKGIQRSLALAIGNNSSSNVSVNSSGGYNKSANQPFRPSKGSSSGAGNKLRHPSGYCFHFHNKRCGKSNCRFLHQCWMPGCGEKHSVYKCPKFQNQSKTSKTGSTNVSKQSSVTNASKA